MTELVGIRGPAIQAGWGNRLAALLLLACGAGRVHAQVLLFNGHAFHSESRVAVLSPGVMNRLEIARADSGRAKGRRADAASRY